MNPDRARTKLDKYVELRRAIAHPGAAATSVKEAQVMDYFEFLKRLVDRTDRSANVYVRAVIKKPLWT
jgi:hypothetical protein